MDTARGRAPRRPGGREGEGGRERGREVRGGRREGGRKEEGREVRGGRGGEGGICVLLTKEYLGSSPFLIQRLVAKELEGTCK